MAHRGHYHLCPCRRQLGRSLPKRPGRGLDQGHGISSLRPAGREFAGIPAAGGPIQDDDTPAHGIAAGHDEKHHPSWLARLPAVMALPLARWRKTLNRRHRSKLSKMVGAPATSPKEVFG